MKKGPSIPPYAIAMVLGALPAMMAFNAIFSDIYFQTYVEAMTSRFIITASAYAILGLIMGFFWDKEGWFNGIWLGIPLMAIHLFFFIIMLHSIYKGYDTAWNLIKEYLFYTFFFGGGILAACITSQAGAMIRKRFK